MNKDLKLATEHWNWLESLLRKIYIDTFIHGYKHGMKDEKEEVKKSGT